MAGRHTPFFASVLCQAACWIAVATPVASAQTTGVAQIRKDAEAMMSLVEQSITKAFLEAVSQLPEVKPRPFLRDPKTKKIYTRADADKLDDATRKTLTPVTIGESFYYNTRYGSPLGYARPLEILGKAGLKDVSGKKILDFGYGTVGHLRLLALGGAQVVGVEVDPLLPSLYSDPGDQGPIRGKGGRLGSIQLVDGQFPANPEVAKAVGDGYDVILSKNTLKNGYLHPSQPVDKSLLVDLQVEDAVFLRALHAALKPGGKVLIYNLSPAPSKAGEPYKPWADGKCPFSVAQWEAAGFKVLAFDRDDNEAARKMGHALGWDGGPNPMDLTNDLFSHYTLVEKPATAKPAPK